MPKKLCALGLAALLAGMTAFAPLLSGHCALPGAGAGAMAAMAAHARMAIGGPAAPSRGPASSHQHACCNNCLGPCAGCAAVLPAAGVTLGTIAFSSVRRAPASAPLAAPAVFARLLPFANGPPSHLG